MSIEPLIRLYSKRLLIGDAAPMPNPVSSFSQGNLQKFDTVDLPSRNQAPWLTDAVGTLASGSRQGAVESRLDNPGPWDHPWTVVGLWHVAITPASCPAQLPMRR